MDWVRGFWGSSASGEDGAGRTADAPPGAVADAADAARRERTERLTANNLGEEAEAPAPASAPAAAASPPPGPQPPRAYSDKNKATLEAGDGLRFVRTIFSWASCTCTRTICLRI
eukprot:COSAG02_NODE_2604_length_8443_cov_6.439593_2_plen_115_part_00